MPVTPFAAAEYRWSLLPLLTNLARTGDREDRTGDEPRGDSTLVLIPLDDSQNAILSFGEVPSDALADDRGKPVAAGESSVRQGDGGSTPWVTTKERRGRLANFGIEWDLDPATLAAEVSRRNAHIAPTASLPQRLGVILLHDIRQLPVQPANYSIPRAVNLWDRNGYGREKVTLPPDMAAMRLILEANGFRQITHSYRLARAYRIDLRDEYDDDIEAGCLLLEFELLRSGSA
jgi:hypothetical protein